jgi:hypothetical protein
MNQDISKGDISKGDIVEHKITGQTFRVVSNVAGQLRVKGNGTSITLALSAVKKAPPRVPPAAERN